MSRSSSKSDVSALIESALAEVERGDSFRMDLPEGGKLQINPRSPFLCIYRRSGDQKDEATERLVTAEASHVVFPAERRAARAVSQVVRALVARLAQEFGAFLLIEIWSAALLDKTDKASENGDDESLEPRFEILAPVTRIPRATIEALAKALGKEVLPFGGTRTILKPLGELAPQGMKPLVALSDLRDSNCYVLGLIVRPVYWNESSEELNPATMRTIGHMVHCALDQAYFTFVQQRKSLRPAHYQAPKTDAVVKEVLDIDRQLAEIDRSFDLLLQATPVNAESAWREFRRSQFQKPPVFYYRPMPIDPVLLKRQLYLIPIERVEDPTLCYLFRQKQQELDRQITLLTDIDTSRFLPESLQIYGGVSDWLLQHAQEVLDRVPTRGGGGPTQGKLSATEFAKRAQQELGYYQQQSPDFAGSVAVRDDFYAGMMVSGDQLLIGGRTRVARRRIEALLQHEIGTHLVTRYNGRHQPFQQLEVGLAGYDGLQEGLAVLSEYLVGGLSRHRMRILAARVVAAHHLLDGAPFIDTFRVLNRNLVFSQRTAYTIAMRTYRGGGLTKDAVYLRGLLQILRYLREGGDLEPLFIGKVASAHLPLIAELRARGIIKPPILRPRYLENPKALERLERLRAGMKLLELLQG